MKPDGSLPFYDEPDDVVGHLENNVLENIENGYPEITKVTLPYFEEEAIERIRAQTGHAPTEEPDRRKEGDLWRAKWVCEAQYLERNRHNYNEVARAAIDLLLIASRLRGEILRDADEGPGNPQLVAALSMLLVCRLFEGGYSIKARKHEEAAKPFTQRRGRQGKESKTLLYERYATLYPGDNDGAANAIFDAQPPEDDGESPFFWGSNHKLMDRKNNLPIDLEKMKKQLQKARQRMKKPAKAKPKKTLSKVS